MNASPKNCIEINAGKCTFDGNIVKPDMRKGKLVLCKISDSIYNLQWVNRENNEVEDNLILTKDISLERVKQCTTGRVYLLRKKSHEPIAFYWMQNFDESKDEMFVKHLNSVVSSIMLNCDSNKKQTTITDYIPKMSEMLFSQNKNFQNTKSKNAVSFKDFFTNESFSKLLEMPGAVEELKKHMPQGYQSKECILHVINNQFLNLNLKTLDASLFSCLNFILVSLNLPPHKKQISDPMEYLVEALEKKYKKKEN